MGILLVFVGVYMDFFLLFFGTIGEKLGAILNKMSCIIDTDIDTAGFLLSLLGVQATVVVSIAFGEKSLEANRKLLELSYWMAYAGHFNAGHFNAGHFMIGVLLPKLFIQWNGFVIVFVIGFLWPTAFSENQARPWVMLSSCKGGCLPCANRKNGVKNAQEKWRRCSL